MLFEILSLCHDVMWCHKILLWHQWWYISLWCSVTSCHYVMMSCDVIRTSSWHHQHQHDIIKWHISWLWSQIICFILPEFISCWKSLRLTASSTGHLCNGDSFSRCPFAYKLHLFGQFCASLRVNKISRKVFPLLDAVSLQRKIGLNWLMERSLGEGSSRDNLSTKSIKKTLTTYYVCPHCCVVAELLHVNNF